MSRGATSRSIDCVEFGPACPQPEVSLLKSPGRHNEDCLYLNPEWPRYDAAGDRHLEFGDSIRAGNGLYREGCDVLERVVRQETGMAAK